MRCQPRAPRGRKSTRNCLASPLWWTSGGKASSATWSHAASRPYGGPGSTRVYSHSSRGHISWPTPGARGGKPRCARPSMRSTPRCTRIPSPHSWPLAFLKNGKRGPPSGCRSFSGPRRPWKGVMAICRTCIRTIEACPSAETRCGRFYTTLMVALQMGRHQHRDFSGGRSQIFLKRCCPTSMPCLRRGDENILWRSVLDVIKCPALSGSATRGRTVDCLACCTDQTCCSISSILRGTAAR